MLERAGTLMQDRVMSTIEVILTASREWTLEIIMYETHAMTEITTYDSASVGNTLLWQPCR